jgi:hypothetical protein
MDNANIDKLTKDILANSKLELTNYAFNNMVMNKIRHENRKQSISHNIGLYFLIFITYDTLIFSILKLMNISLTGINLKIDAFIHGIFFSIQNGFSNIGHFIFIYFLILAMVIFAVNKILGSQYRYSNI